MKLNSVLIVFKHRVGNAENCGQKFAARHEDAIDLVEASLIKAGIKTTLVERDELTHETKADLIISVGGDGTVLKAAHMAGDTPVLGVNSMPGYSVGFFCATDAGSFEKTLNKLLDDKLGLAKLPLIATHIDGRLVPELALNDVLFAGTSPAETARYTIRKSGAEESQRSSGVWIAAGPGSTAAMRSAGGRVLKINSKHLQFIVREPYCSKETCYNVTRGTFKNGDGLTIVSEMQSGHIYIDGPKINHPAPLGSKIIFSISKQHLKIFLPQL